MKDSKATFWPYGIAIFLFIMVCMIILTVIISIKNAPEDDNAYFSTRQDVDKNINDILIHQKELENLYSFYIINGKYMPLEHKATRQSTPIKVVSNQPITIEVMVKKNDIASDAKMLKLDSAQLYITRFATSKDDIDLGELDINGGIAKSKSFSLKRGYWKALLKFEIDGKVAYFEQLIISDTST